VFTRTVEVVITRPLDEVFAFVSDARNRPSWLAIPMAALSQARPVRESPEKK